jgi:hypothetical protein
MHHCAMIKKISLVIVALLACALAPLACGGGSASPGSDFCAKFATALCQKNFACPDPNNPLPFTMSQCVEAFTHTCTDKPPAGQVNHPSCYGATHVNTAAQTECLNGVASSTCDQINTGPNTFDDVCDMVCTTGSTTGSAGATGTGGSTTGTGGSTGTGGTTVTGTGGTTTTGTGGSTGAGGSVAGAPADGMAFCMAFASADCDQEFKCIPPNMRDSVFVAQNGSTIAECKSTIAAQNCVGFGAMCMTYSQLLAQTCISKYSSWTCDQLATATALPGECLFACQ